MKKNIQFCVVKMFNYECNVFSEKQYPLLKLILQMC